MLAPGVLLLQCGEGKSTFWGVTVFFLLLFLETQYVGFAEPAPNPTSASPSGIGAVLSLHHAALHGAGSFSPSFPTLPLQGYGCTGSAASPAPSATHGMSWDVSGAPSRAVGASAAAACPVPAGSAPSCT